MIYEFVGPIKGSLVYTQSVYTERGVPGSSGEFRRVPKSSTESEEFKAVAWSSKKLRRDRHDSLIRRARDAECALCGMNDMKDMKDMNDMRYSA